MALTDPGVVHTASITAGHSFGSMLCPGYELYSV